MVTRRQEYYPEEKWKVIPDFQNYEISNYGRVYNRRGDHYMRPSFSLSGHMKITLTYEYSSIRYTRSVAQMVAEAFVEPPNALCDSVVILDGDLTNIVAENLVWRPKGFSLVYSRQLKTCQPKHFKFVPVINITKNIEYSCIVDAGISEGLIFLDIWRSTYSGVRIFPDGSIFEIL